MKWFLIDTGVLPEPGVASALGNQLVEWTDPKLISF